MGSGAKARPPTTVETATRLAAEAEARKRARALADAEDAELMRTFQKGDARAFTKLSQRHQGALFTFCTRMLGGREVAEDATQEVFLKIVRSAERWTSQATVRTWMFAIARNYCIDEIRKAKHRQTDSLDRPLKEDGGAASVGDLVADEKGLGPDRGAASVRMRDRLANAIGALPEEQREVFLMREQVGLPFKEIAEVIGVPENTAKSRMRYALQGLRASLAKQGVTREDLGP